MVLTRIYSFAFQRQVLSELHLRATSKLSDMIFVRQAYVDFLFISIAVLYQINICITPELQAP
jgi:hypothetical protein